MPRCPHRSKSEAVTCSALGEATQILEKWHTNACFLNDQVELKTRQLLLIGVSDLLDPAGALAQHVYGLTTICKKNERV